MQYRSIAGIILFIGLLSGPGIDGHAQNLQYEEEPTGGIHIPSAGIAGQADATTATLNPAGLSLLDGNQFVLALDLAREEGAVRSGPGGGIFYGGKLGDGSLSTLGFGMALEWLRPASAALRPNPGTPTRLTLSTSIPLGDSSALGYSWHHFFDRGGLLDDLDTHDIGWTTRFGSHWAFGMVVKDFFAPRVASKSVQRRYEGEIVSRAWGTDRLELGLGLRIGEKDFAIQGGEGLDTWLRWSLKLRRGVYFRGELASESLHQVMVSPGAKSERFLRDYQASLGLEFSFGGLGTSAFGSVVRNTDAKYQASGGTFVARLSPQHIPSVLPETHHMERLDLSGSIGERRLTSIVTHLRRIADDENVVGLFVHLDGVSGGWASLHEIRNELKRIRKLGKPVFVFTVSANTREYYLASVATKIYVDPAGGVALQGFSGTSLYYKGLFEKLGVEAQFEKIEEYKSAPEAWTRTGPTEIAEGMRNDLYDSLYQTMVADIALSRGIGTERVRTLIDNGPYTSGELEKLPDLVDAVVLADELGPLIEKVMGKAYPVREGAVHRPQRWTLSKIAVVYIDGDIVGGQSQTIPLLGRSLVGGQTIAEVLESARLNDEIKAVVLRINSPGGSALASEFMAREVAKLRGVKPIVCSMGNMAASGGYFAAAYCDYIFADPMTITGSIGIFNGSFNLSGLLEKLGISWKTFKRGEHADLGSLYRKMSEKERKFMKQKLHYYYGRFIKTVAEGRKMSTEEVDKVGRGHVWTGEQSLAIHLVDKMGGLIDAIDYAKAKAGLGKGEKARLILLPKVQEGLLGQALGSLAQGVGFDKGVMNRVDDEQRKRALVPYLALLGLLPGSMAKNLLEAIPGSLWHQPGVPQARLPFSILWQE